MHYSPRDFHACTKTTSVIDKGSNTIRVTNTAKMNVGDMILIDYVFCYRNKYLETNTIESILAPNAITLKSGVKMRHPSCVNVMCVDTMPRKQLVLAQQTLFRIQLNEPIDKSCQYPCLDEVQCDDHCDEEHCDEEHCDEDHCDEDHCDEEHCDEDHCDEEHCDEERCDGIILNKVKHDHDHVGLFSNNFIKIS
jgi:hypothetical protein